MELVNNTTTNNDYVIVGEEKTNCCVGICSCCFKTEDTATGTMIPVNLL